LDLHPVDILFHIINIIVLFILLRILIWKPVVKFTSARAAKVKTELDDATSAKSIALAMKTEYEQNLARLDAQGAEIIHSRQEKATEEAHAIIKNAQVAANNIMADAREKIENEKKKAVASAGNQIVQLATVMASRVLKREVAAADTKSVVEDFFNEME